MFIDYILFASCLFILVGSLYISFKTKFVQLRLFPLLFKMFWQSVLLKKEESKDRVLPHKALLTAMSTTLGISTIAGPAIAISLGGPGALIGFLLTSILGSAATFTEVSLCVKYRSRLQSGEIIGGPMGYLKWLLSPMMAKWYAFSCCIVMTAWSGCQANQLAAIFDSPLLGSYRIDPLISGVVVAVLIFFSLSGGIKRVSSLSSKIVPLMFTLYLCSCCWILYLESSKLIDVFSLIISSAFTPVAMASGTLVGGVVSALRWGIFKGTQSNEAGIGTQTIPHSMSNSDDATLQGTLSMISTYTAGFIAFLSGLVVLVTGTWNDPELPVGISMVAASFQSHFSYWGVTIVAFCTFLFAFGTILGNSFNGGQCFLYLVDSKWMRHYFVFVTLIILMGAISPVKTFWSYIDIFLACMAVPHMFALVRYIYGENLAEAIQNR